MREASAVEVKARQMRCARGVRLDGCAKKCRHAIYATPYGEARVMLLEM